MYAFFCIPFTYICYMKNKYITTDQFRIQLICKILEKGASLQKIMSDVNDQLRENNLKQYSKRIYSEDIRKIREGELIEEDCFNYENAGFTEHISPNVT